MAIFNLYTRKYLVNRSNMATVTINHQLEICCRFLRYRSLHIRTAVARLPLRQLGVLVKKSANIWWSYGKTLVHFLLSRSSRFIRVPLSRAGWRRWNQGDCSSRMKTTRVIDDTALTPANTETSFTISRHLHIICLSSSSLVHLRCQQQTLVQVKRR